MDEKRFRMNCLIWATALDPETRGDTETSSLAAAHLRFFDYICALVRSMQDPVKKEKLMEAVVEYMDVFIQCDFNVRKAHEILCNRYDYKNEKEETR